MNPVHEKLPEVTATDLRIRAAQVLRDAEYGQPTLITREGQPVAKVVPVDAGTMPTREQWEAARDAHTTALTHPSEHRAAVLALGNLLNTYYQDPQ